MEKINFYLPDFSGFFIVLDKTINLLKKYPEIFYPGVNIGAVYGNFPGCIWDGGSRMKYGTVTSDAMKKFKDLYNKNGIPVRLTMTNMLLEDSHLYDTYANTILKIFHNDFQNEVLVASDLVESYIRNEYPNYRIIRSTCIAENKPYDDTDRYFMSVLDRRQNHNIDFLNSITNKDKIEFVTNELCMEGCPYMYEHYRHSSRLALKYLPPDNTFCQRMHANDDIDPESLLFRYHYNKNNNSAWISREYLYNTLVPMGFSNFKLVGRGYDIGYTIAGILEYMVKPEFFTDVFLILTNEKILGSPRT